MFIREKKIDCTDYREVDIIPRTDNAERAVRGKRKKREKETEPQQKDLNDKNARRYLVQLGNGNFKIGDLHVSCTYDDMNYPKTVEEAEKIVTNYLRRIAYRRSKLQPEEPMKYILVTEYEFDKDGNTVTRIHHHIIMNGGIKREEIEVMWTKERINWKRYESDKEYREWLYSRLMGWVNADRLQMNENGIEGLCKYITKNPKGKKRWSSSRNLVRPLPHNPADHKYSRAQVERLAKSPDAGREFFERKFPDYNITSIKPEYYKDTGWHIYLKMWRKKSKPVSKQKQKQKKKSNGVIPKLE